MIDDPQWQRMVAHRESAVLSFGDAETASADVVVCTPAWWERHRGLTAGKAVLLVTDGAPGRGATNSLTVDTAGGRAEVVVTADAQSSRVLWELTPIERRTLLGEDIDADGTVAPIEGVDLRLGEVVHMPGRATPAGAQKIPVAAAPAVATAGQATPDTTAAPASAPRRAPVPREVAPLRAPTTAPQLPPMAPLRSRGQAGAPATGPTAVQVPGPGSPLPPPVAPRGAPSPPHDPRQQQQSRQERPVREPRPSEHPTELLSPVQPPPTLPQVQPPDQDVTPPRLQRRPGRHHRGDGSSG